MAQPNGGREPTTAKTRTRQLERSARQHQETKPENPGQAIEGRAMEGACTRGLCAPFFLALDGAFGKPRLGAPATNNKPQASQRQSTSPLHP
jgi:hypothetical protein